VKRRFAMLRQRGPLFPLAVLIGLVAGCSTDPTSTDEYRALERELAAAESSLTAAESSLATVEANLSTVDQELAALLEAADETPAGSIMPAPPELAGLVDDWFAALHQGDDSVLDLYVAQGYHLYGDTRFEYDELVAHLTAGPVEHEWITEPMLVAEDADGRYVVVRGMLNTGVGWHNASALLFEVVTTPDDELRLVQTAWFYDSEW
jgi:hypothetical protein